MENTLSIWKEFGPLLEKELGQEIPVSREPWRPGDQRAFIADIKKATQDFGWKPEVNVETGIRKLFDWVRANRDLF
ncbi:MAG: GDP-mannose 4,6-dehydratase [Chloroflexi bacterium]|nr:GDP-mannose 4,6-dehydratase [Chloroflexota bacterium]